jgi:hypothetical protein
LTVVDPRKVRASEGGTADALSEKNSMTNGPVLAVESRLPWMVIWTPSVCAEASTGKFCN